MVQVHVTSGWSWSSTSPNRDNPPCLKSFNPSFLYSLQPSGNQTWQLKIPFWMEVLMGESCTHVASLWVFRCHVRLLERYYPIGLPKIEQLSISLHLLGIWTRNCPQSRSTKLHWWPNSTRSNSSEPALSRIRGTLALLSTGTGEFEAIPSRYPSCSTSPTKFKLARS